MATLQTSVIWVCEDCYLTHHGYSTDELGCTPDREPLSLIGDDCEVWSGGEHEDDCPNVGTDGEWIGEGDCECERISFTWSRCEGCGSTLGGSREALTIAYSAD